MLMLVLSACSHMSYAASVSADYCIARTLKEHAHAVRTYTSLQVLRSMHGMQQV
jgi:hypothetical protein